MKITDLKCAVMGNSAVVRITTDQGISGYGQGETTKPYLKPFVLFYKDYLIGEDPTNVERCMMKIRRMGSFKPWGAAVSAIEIALWDIAGKAAGLPVYKLLGGKIRDQVRCYNGSVRVERTGNEPKDYIGLALDCGPGMLLSDAIRLAVALEPYNLMWCEDMLTGDYTPYVMADDYCELTRSTSTPIHTGEQIYLRQNFRELIEKHAVRILGPDPEDMGGIAEMKWVSEYADLHSIQFAPHGT
ncbi:MAG: mandelate racemase/muconate lactonizing enzyme family protein, partial [Bacteroidia bacterium]|nr:mandelate racemase/muconate lactonizing enzyme family protein [Bacteroidia bacterium]